MTTAVSLFAGVGGFDLALTNNNVKVVASVEIDSHARGVLKERFPDTQLFEDVTEVTANDLFGAGFIPEDGIIVGGFPCQDLSIAGRRAGLAGQRSGLYWEIVRLTGETRPKWLILENVPGLLSSNGGRDMGTVIGALVELGYDVTWRVLDAQHFGVPQRRRRVFIVAGRSGAGSVREVLFESDSSQRNPDTRNEERQETPTDAPGGSGSVSEPGLRSDPAVGNFELWDFPVGDHSHTLNARRARDSLTWGTTFVKARRAHSSEDYESWREDDIAPTVNAFDSGDTRATVLSIKPVVRRLTPVECERLQGFPDNWTAAKYDFRRQKTVPQADSNRYKQMGNAVAVPVVDWIVKRLLEVENG